MVIGVAYTCAEVCGVSTSHTSHATGWWVGRPGIFSVARRRTTDEQLHSGLRSAAG